MREPKPTKPVTLIDSHCHLDFNEFDTNREQILQDCLDLGIQKIILPGVSAKTWQRTLNLSQQYNCLSPALGLHPYFIAEHEDQHLHDLEQRLLSDETIIAVGEIGLDFYDKTSLLENRERQIELFELQLLLAKKHDLPVIIHNRKAHDLAIKLLDKLALKGGIIHAFSGSIQQAQKYSEMGYLLGFGGMSTWPQSRRLRTLLQQLNPEQIALETDAPDMKPYGVTSEFNSPTNLPMIGKKIAEIKGMDYADLAEQTSKQVQQLFKLNFKLTSKKNNETA